MKTGPKPLTTEEYKIKLLEKTKGEFILIGEYKNIRIPVILKHIKCNNVFQTNSRQFLRAKNAICPYCNKMTHEKFIKKVNEISNGEITVLGKYISARNKIKVVHNKCGYERDILPSNVLRYKCPKCSNNLRKTTECFIEEVRMLVGNEYKVISEYIASNKYIRIKHIKCNHEYDVKPNTFLKGCRCPWCSHSHGEERVIKFLEENNIKFKKEYCFKDLKGDFGVCLRIDFAIFNYDDTLKCLIEYDGEFHYIQTNINDFKKNKKYDRRKNNYCIKNNIELIRIHYKDFNIIEKILNERLF